MEIPLWLAFAAASTALLPAAGPTGLFVFANEPGQGRRIAVATVLAATFASFHHAAS
jgi:threonine/homoserine/homoserine lactone efflux protein